MVPGAGPRIDPGVIDLTGDLPVERPAIEGHDDDLTAMVVIALIVVLLHVDPCEGERHDVPALEVDAGALELGPVVDGAIGVPEEVHGRIVGKPHVRRG
jgi:hypothetical protein